MSDRFDHTLERKLDSKPDGAESAGTSVRRLELITGVTPEACDARGRWRQWSHDDKTRVLLESLQPGANVSEVARANGLSPQQLFGWRRDARALFDEGVGAGGSVILPGPSGPRPRGRPRMDRSESQFADAPVFAPVVVAAPPAALAPPTVPAARPPPAPTVPPLAAGPLPGMIEIAIGDATVRIGGDVAAPLIAAVLGALRGLS